MCACMLHTCTCSVRWRALEGLQRGVPTELRARHHPPRPRDAIDHQVGQPHGQGANGVERDTRGDQLAGLRGRAQPPPLRPRLPIVDACRLVRVFQQLAERPVAKAWLRRVLDGTGEGLTHHVLREIGARIVADAIPFPRKPPVTSHGVPCRRSASRRRRHSWATGRQGHGKRARRRLLVLVNVAREVVDQVVDLLGAGELHGTGGDEGHCLRKGARTLMAWALLGVGFGDGPRGTPPRRLR